MFHKYSKLKFNQMEKEKFLREFMQKVWNEKKFDCITNYVAPAYTIHIDSSDPWEGKTLNYVEFAMRLDYSFDSLPNINFEIQTAISDGDDVTASWIMTGTNDGKNGPFPPTNKKSRILGSTIYHFAGDKICGHTQVFDRIDQYQQIVRHGSFQDPINT